MKILSVEHLTVSFADAAEGLNRAPKDGDEGHTDDHGRLSRLLLEVPQTEMGLGYAGKFDGQWHLSTVPGVDPEPSTFQAVRDFVERPGVVAISEDPHDAADGTTDHTTDSALLDDISLSIVASGVVGLTYAVTDLIQQVNALKSAQA